MQNSSGTSPRGPDRPLLQSLDHPLSIHLLHLNLLLLHLIHHSNHHGHPLFLLSSLPLQLKSIYLLHLATSPLFPLLALVHHLHHSGNTGPLLQPSPQMKMKMTTVLPKSLQKMIDDDEEDQDEDEEDEEDPTADETFHSTAYANLSSITQPRTFKDSQKYPESSQWKKACMEELEAHKRNGTWKIVQLPPGKQVVGSKWHLKVKRNADGSVERSKQDLWPRDTLSALDLTSQRPLPPQSGTLQSGPSLPLLDLKTWRSTPLTSPMPISMVSWKRRSTCSYLKALRTLVTQAMFSSWRRQSMDSDRLAGCGPRPLQTP